MAGMVARRLDGGRAPSVVCATLSRNVERPCFGRCDGWRPAGEQRGRQAQHGGSRRQHLVGGDAACGQTVAVGSESIAGQRPGRSAPQRLSGASSFGLAGNDLGRRGRSWPCRPGPSRASSATTHAPLAPKTMGAPSFGDGVQRINGQQPHTGRRSPGPWRDRAGGAQAGEGNRGPRPNAMASSFGATRGRHRQAIAGSAESRSTRTARRRCRCVQAAHRH